MAMKRYLKRYQNEDGIFNRKKLLLMRKWRIERKQKVKDMSYVVPQHEHKEIEFLRTNRSEITMTWIGHSSFLLQIGGKNLLTDPVWANRMGLEKRLSAPGLRVQELPPIDAILLSHSHYDHMDMGSLRSVVRLNRGVKFYVPAGLKGKLRANGLGAGGIQEASWWDSFTLDGVELTFVPAQHWTRRTLFDTNSSHWGGWVLQRAADAGSRNAIYFVGDSAYFPGFKNIGERFAIRWALMPIGAYEPEWFMGKQHVNPEEAVQAFVDTGAEFCIPMHYGAFRLADDTAREALDRLHAAWQQHELPEERLQVLQLGETLR